MTSFPEVPLSANSDEPCLPSHKTLIKQKNFSGRAALIGRKFTGEAVVLPSAVRWPIRINIHSDWR